jgi:hypothetical protein
MINYILLLTFTLIFSASMANANNHVAGGGLAEPTDPARIQLAPIFVGDDGGIIYLRETGDNVYWYAEHPGRGYAHVFRGHRNGARIRGRMISVPKYADTKTGRVTMEIRTGGNLHQVGEAMNAPFNRLEPRSMSEVKDRLPLQAFPGFQAQSASDFDGGFEDPRGRRYYVRTLGNTVVFFVESRFSQGKRPTAAFVFFGKWTGAERRFATGELVAMPKGKRRSMGSFSLGFLEDRRLSGQSDFEHLQSVLAQPMIQTQRLRLLGDRAATDYAIAIEGGLITVEGDIVVGEIPNLPTGSSPALALADRGQMWPNCEVPFDFDPTFFGQQPGETATAQATRRAVRANIDDAISDWNRDAAITWRRKTAEDRDFVVFTPKTNLCVTIDGISILCGRSPLGRQGGEQKIFFTRPSSPGDVLSRGTFMHEMGHAVGLGHEHTRIDSEDFIEIRWPKIRLPFQSYFQPRGQSTIEVGAYDYGSIMHYGPDAFSIDGSDTIIPKQPGVTIGQRTALSTGDLAGIASFCPQVVQAQGVGKRGDGAGMTLIQADGDAAPELLLMAYDDPDQQNTFKLRLCEFTNGFTALDCQSELHRIDGLGHRGSGAGIAAGRLLGNPNQDDLVVAAYDTTGEVKYRVCEDFRSHGTSRCSGSRKVLDGQRFGARADGLGVAIGNVNAQGGHEVIIAALDDAQGPNLLKWTVGRGFSENSQPRWSTLESTAGPGPFTAFTLGHRGSGLGLALSNQNYDPRPDLVFGVLDDGMGDDHFEIVTLEDLDINGNVNGDVRKRRYDGHGHSAEGAGIAVGDVDSDGARDLILMSYDDPDNDDNRQNNFKVRVIFAGGDR